MLGGDIFVTESLVCRGVSYTREFPSKHPLYYITKFSTVTIDVIIRG